MYNQERLPWQSTVESINGICRRLTLTHGDSCCTVVTGHQFCIAVAWLSIRSNEHFVSSASVMCGRTCSLADQDPRNFWIRRGPTADRWWTKFCGSADRRDRPVAGRVCYFLMTESVINFDLLFARSDHWTVILLITDYRVLVASPPNSGFPVFPVM